MGLVDSGTLEWSMTVYAYPYLLDARIYFEYVRSLRVVYFRSMDS